MEKQSKVGYIKKDKGRNNAMNGMEPFSFAFKFPIIFLTPAIPEYCESENFSPKCGRQEVVVMERAQYGRMELGRCVETDYGYVGCSGK